MKVYIILIHCIVSTLITAQDGPIVDTTWGPVRGSPFTVPGQEGSGLYFLGIPYAAPPVGDLRFEPPEDPSPWSEPHDGTQRGPSCPQDIPMFIDVLEPHYKVNLSYIEHLERNEACLLLNVFTPSLEGSRSVMVFIHGGGFNFGGAEGFDNRYLTSGKDIVSVYIQYRLGPLGWFTTGNEVMEGNMAFKDQVKALNWVRSNIANFGGNPNDVTIYGESAGSYSVSLHLVSPYSSGLFSKAILQSGSLIGSTRFSPPWDLPLLTRYTASLLGCANMTDTEMITCLRALDADAFWKPISPGEPIPYIPAPIVDGDYFPDLPLNLLEKGEFNKDVDIMLGVMDIEGYMFAEAIYPDMNLPGFDRNQFHNGLSMVTIPLYYPHLEDKWTVIAEAATEEYAADLEGDALRHAAAEMLGDVDMCVNTFSTAELWAEHSDKNVFFYEFNQRPSVSIRPSYINTDHGDDLAYMGCTKSGHFLNNTIDFTEDDKRMDDIMLDYWVNFARNGDPNGENLVVWPSYQNGGSYIHLQVTPEIASNYKPERMKFWLETVPDLARRST